MKNKPQKYGVRNEFVADAANGVVVHIEIYSNQAEGLDSTVRELVCRLLSDTGGKNHSVYGSTLLIARSVHDIIRSGILPS